VLPDPPNLPRYIVAQTGARRGYAVPAILEEAGMLEHFYTDVCGNVGWGRWLASLSRVPGAPSSLHKLAHRRVPPSIQAQTSTFAGPNLLWQAQRLLTPTADPNEQFRRDIVRNLELGRCAAQGGFGAATHVYVMFTELPTLLIEARLQHLKVVSEIYINLSADHIVETERRQFTTWEPEIVDRSRVVDEFGLGRLVFEEIDHFICPSRAVADDLVANWRARADQVSIVPYGMSPAWLELQPAPQPGRILFVGSAILRKGIHYLAMAAEELHRRGRRYEFRVAGHVEDAVRNQPVCRHLTFLGRLPRSEVHREYAQADVFTLPSLAEGSAEVTYEALAAALPLVTTAASGSVATDGVEGRIVPERDPIALANALESIIEDRPTRDRMAQSARSTARDYTWERYGERLACILSFLPNAGRSQ
jgi:glycosyltransferase involved in cell wall biosynthesis